MALALAVLLGCGGGGDTSGSSRVEPSATENTVAAYVETAGPLLLEGATRFRYTFADPEKYSRSAPAVADVRTKLSVLDAPVEVAGDAAICVEALGEVADIYTTLSDRSMTFLNRGSEVADLAMRSFTEMTRYQQAAARIYAAAGLAVPTELQQSIPVRR